MVEQLQQMTSILPVAQGALQQSQDVVMRLAANLDSIFIQLRTQGPSIFETVSFYWNIIWGLYFVLFGGLTTGLLMYGLWASGYFGGPQPLAEKTQEEREAIEAGGMSGCFASVRYACCTCLCGGCHDNALCFWSSIILMQLVVLILFVISIAIALIAAVKLLLVQGCLQVYLLNRPAVCSESLVTVQGWLSTFGIRELDHISDQAGFADACVSEELLTCNRIAHAVSTGSVLTVAAAFLATLVSLQLLIESARLHERAVWMRQIATDAKTK